MFKVLLGDVGGPQKCIWLPPQRYSRFYTLSQSRGFGKSWRSFKGALVAVEAEDVDDVVKIEISNLRYRLGIIYPYPLVAGGMREIIGNGRVKQHTTSYSLFRIH